VGILFDRSRVNMEKLGDFLRGNGASELALKECACVAGHDFVILFLR